MSFEARRIFSYAVLYLVWGSTYLAMRFALETLPPFSLAAVRFTFAGLVLCGMAFVRGEPRLSSRAWGRAGAVGLFLCVGGNGLVLWAIQRVPSGTAALVVAITPLWLALMTRAKATPRLVGGIALGLLGVGILVGPAVLAGSERVDPTGVTVLLCASILWAIGSLIQRGGENRSALYATGAQMICGGLMLLVIGVVVGEGVSFYNVSVKSVAAFGYLTIFGSLLGFTSFAWLMRNDVPTRVATYAYVNPIIAVILGTILGGEPLTVRVIAAAAVIVTGVVAILGQRRI